MSETKYSKYDSFKCDVCDHRVSKTAWVCPNCGFVFWDDADVFWKPIRKLLSGTLWKFLKILWIAIAWLVIISVILVPIIIAFRIFVIA